MHCDHAGADHAGADHAGADHAGAVIAIKREHDHAIISLLLVDDLLGESLRAQLIEIPIIHWVT